MITNISYVSQFNKEAHYIEFHLHNIDVEELTITMIQEAMENGEFTMYYLYRIVKGDKMYTNAGMIA